jgi:CBS domain containing-hemolysin-like protein
MPDDSSSGARWWKAARDFLFGEREGTLRDQIAEVIDDHDGDEADKDSDVSPAAREMLRRVLELGETRVDDVAVPRADIIAVPETIAFEALVAAFADAGHSRLPVYRESLDEIVGMIHVKDVFAILAGKARPPKTIAKLIRQPRYVPTSMGVLELLAEMRLHQTHLAIVIDEYSGTEGLLTIEDLVEEIVGEIEDEHDEAPVDLLVPLEGGLWEADARAELEDVAQRLDTRLGDVEEDVDTLGGLAFVVAGHVPQIGEIVTHPSGWRIEVIEGDAKRASRLRLHPPPADTVDE